MKRQFNSEQRKNGTVLHNKIRSTKTEIVDHGTNGTMVYNGSVAIQVHDLCRV